MAKKSLNIRIDQSTILFVAALVLGLKFISRTKEILIMFFIAYLVSVAVYPFVNFLKNKLRIPRSLSAAIILIGILVSILTAVGSTIPPVIAETTNFLRQFPQIISRLGVYNLDLNSFSSQLSNIPANLLLIAINTFSAGLFLSTVMVISFYLIRERPLLENRLQIFFGKESADHMEKTILEIETKLGYWVRGEVILMVTIGVLSYIGFTLIGLDYALPLAIIAGLLELVPNLGPTIATIPAAIVGFSISPLHGVLTILVSIIVQQLENNFIVPMIMRKATGLHPVVTIISLLIGFKLGGTLLAILALPLVLTILTITKHYFSRHFPEGSPIIST